MKVVKARGLDGYRLELELDNGTHGVVDLGDLAGEGVFAAWSEPGAFENLSIGSAGEVAWACGVDLCPDALYLRLTGQKPEELFPSLQTVKTSA